METLSSNIFDTVPEDYLSLYKGNRPQYNRVAGFLNLKKEDISKATGVVQSSVRYDEKMPTELKERLQEWAILLNHVAGHFKGDGKKTTMWFVTPNPLLGYETPRDMIRFGRFKKLFKFVVDALADNRR